MTANAPLELELKPTAGAPIGIQDVSGQQTILLAPTTQEWNWAKISINRSGSGGTHPWLNSLTSADTLGVLFEYSLDGGSTWHPMSQQTLAGDGTSIVKGVLVPQTNEVGVGIGVAFPTGTRFRIVLTASTPLTFNGSAEFG